MTAMLFLIAALVAASPGASGYPAASRLVISDFGETYTIPGAIEVGTPAEGLRAVFDVAVGSEDPAEVNRRIETVARFLNMHAAAGYPRERLQAVLVLHGTAARDALDNTGFRRRYGTGNPNLLLLEQLAEAGVGVFLCGQSAASRGLDADEIAAPVEVALSAMTVLLAKQAEGYGLIAF